MKKPVDINVDQIKREIQQNRTMYQIMEKRVAALVNVIQSLKTLRVKTAAKLFTVGPYVWWDAQLCLHEADLATLRFEQVRQDEIHAALQELLEAAEDRLTVS